MSDYALSPNMNMPVPVVGTAPGPTWAELVNSCLAILDNHNHSSGSGAPVTPDGLNINSELSMGGNDLIAARSLRMSAQGSPIAEIADLDCLYVSGVDLYYNDGNGNQIQITDSGGVAGSPGSISNLTSPASATYVAASDRFVWQSDSNTAADMDCGSIILRNLTASSFGLTLDPPLAMGANYTLTLPSLPASQKFLTLDASGNMAASWAVDSSTVEISSNTLQIKALGVGTGELAAGAVTQPKLGASNTVFQSSATTAFTTTSTSYVDVTLATVTITSLAGRTIEVFAIPAGGTTANDSGIVASGNAGLAEAYFAITDGSNNVLGQFRLGMFAGSAAIYTLVPPGVIHYAQTSVLSTSYTFKLRVKVATGSAQAYNLKLVAKEA